MRQMLQKTFGGLTGQYYCRQLVFGLLVAGFVVFMSMQGGRSMPATVMLYIVISTLLYPYARFVYESVIRFIMGDNVFFINTIFMLVTKFFTMSLCWAFALFVAPIGLVYLYFHHSKSEQM
ncbi:MAG: hypothetical protein FHP94_20435 [Denitromonas halophila]|nr:MAG: hypothetical protein FHP94_20435 [Denitromonas halophila]TVT63947.1 MAG: hypothetical protein FHP93_20430 [Denitromonas halophila]